MAIIGLELEENNIINDFIVTMQDRLKSNNLVKNPFNTKCYMSSKDGIKLFILSIDPVYFNYSIFGWIISFGAFVLKGFSWWLLPGIVLGSLGVFWSSHFYYYMLRFALKKKGYTGSILRLNQEEIIKRLISERCLDGTTGSISIS